MYVPQYFSQRGNARVPIHSKKAGRRVRDWAQRARVVVARRAELRRVLRPLLHPQLPGLVASFM